MATNDIRSERFTFLCNPAERQLIATIAKHLNRSQADAIRFLVGVAVKELIIDEDDSLVRPMVSMKSVDESVAKNSDKKS